MLEEILDLPLLEWSFAAGNEIWASIVPHAKVGEELLGRVPP